MSNGGSFANNPRKKNIQDYPALKLTAPKEGTVDRNPSMMIYTHHNESNESNSNCRIVVYTQCAEQDPKKQKIEVQCSLVDMVTILKAIQKVAQDPNEKVEPLVAQSYRPKDFRNRAAGKIEDVKVVVGKNEQGVFISLVHWNTEVPRKRFYFGYGDMFDFVVNAEKGQTFAQFSALRAIAHTEILQTYMVEQMKHSWKPWVPTNNGGGNNNGGWNKPANNTSATSSMDDDDDIFG